MDQNIHGLIHLFEYSDKRVSDISYFVIAGVPLLLLFFSMNANHIYAQYENVTINTTKLTDSIYMLEGSGGNIAVSVGQDGVFIVDDQFAPLTVKIKEAISKISDKPIKFVINTHWHSDHTGGNENLGELGAIIISHDNVRKRLSSDQVSEFFNRTVPALSEKGLPIVTFSNNITIYQNGDEVRIVHVDNGHTDGDSIVYFTKNNVIHVGDDFNDKSYPFIDISSSGSIDGLISSLETISSTINDETQVISGHTGIYNKTKVNDFTNMLKDIRDQVSQMKGEGQSLDQIIASNITATYDQIYHENTSRKPQDFVTFV
jgi:cyclase